MDYTLLLLVAVLAGLGGYAIGMYDMYKNVCREVLKKYR